MQLVAAFEMMTCPPVVGRRPTLRLSGGWLLAASNEHGPSGEPGGGPGGLKPAINGDLAQVTLTRISSVIALGHRVFSLGVPGARGARRINPDREQPGRRYPVIIW